MSNSMKDLLLGLGFKPKHMDVQVPRAQDARERPKQMEPHGQPDRQSRDARAPRSGDARTGAPAASKQRPDHPPRQQHPARKPSHAPGRDPQARDAGRQRTQTPQRTREEIDLAKAYAIRAQKEKDERIEAERLKQEAARVKREAKEKVSALLKGKALNAADAELARHFEYNGKIRRVHVNAAQLKSLNAGDLGVVQLDGRYLLVDAALAREVHALLPNLVALLVDPDAPVAADPYADPQFQVPDDLVW